jgi:hypothetical protein
MTRHLFLTVVPLIPWLEKDLKMSEAEVDAALIRLQTLGYQTMWDRDGAGIIPGYVVAEALDISSTDSRLAELRDSHNSPTEDIRHVLFILGVDNLPI